MVDKLIQQKLNLVILLDAGEKMNTYLPSQTPGAPPISHLTMAKHAATRLIKELAYVDRVSVVVMKGTSTTPPGCADRLMVSTDHNVDLLTSFIRSAQPAAQPDPGLPEGFQTAYTLLQGEKNAREGRKDTNDVILFLTNGEYVVLKEEETFANIKTGQDRLNNKVTHLVYLIHSGSLTPALPTLINLADLNNVQLTNATQWNKNEFSGPVGPVGRLYQVPDTARFQFAESVAEFYKFFPRGTAGGMDRLSAVSPHRDPNTGLLLTYAIPIYNGTKDLSTLYGVAAVDVSMAALFDDVINFRWRRHSYSFIVERERGLVLAHPKLDNPAAMTDVGLVLSSMEFVEPTLTSDQRATILAAGTSASILDAEIVPGRTTYKTGLGLSNIQKHQAKVVYSRLPDTDYIVVLVIFHDELSPNTDTSADNSHSLGFKGLALYHHQLTPNKTADDVLCASSGDKLTVKFSPEVFTEPELYIHSRERAEQVANMTDFLTQDAPPPPVIRPDALGSVLRDLRVVSSLSLSKLWIDASVDGVVERMIGTPSGVFAAYPGISLPNAFDGKQYAWYRESNARPGIVWVSLHRSFTTPDRRIVLSTTVGDSQGLFGVVGVAVSRRSFAGLFFNAVEQCLSAEYTCHLLTDDGYLLDVLDTTTPPGAQRHLTSLYPWLANELLQRHVMKPAWCTTLSIGKHSLTYTVHVPAGGVNHKTNVQDTCRQFLLYRVQGSNLLVLVLVNRQEKGCSEVTTPLESCSSCRRQPGGGPRCQKCLAIPQPPPFSTTAAVSTPLPPSLCQCPCQCDVDFSRCQDSFRHDASLTFPFTPCYEEPEMPNLSSQTGTDLPSTILPPCDQLCPSFEKKEDCEAVSHCQWADSDPYPVCRAHLPTSTTSTTSTSYISSTISTTTATATRTKTPTDKSSLPPPHAQSTTFLPHGQTTETKREGLTGEKGDDSQLGGGAIAGIVVGVAAVLAVGFLIGYYKLLKPRLFTRLLETESVAEGDGAASSSARYNSHNDSLDLSVPPLSPSDISAAPAPESTTAIVSGYNS